MTIHRKSHSTGGITLHAKGAPELLWKLCNSIWIEGKLLPITEDVTRRFESTLLNMGQRGSRLIGCALLHLPGSKYADTFRFDSEKANYPKDGYTFIGMMGLDDPPKEGVGLAIKQIRTAGVKVCMVTGDNHVTAEVNH